MTEPVRAASPPDFDALVVGAGFAGLLALYRLGGLGLRVQVVEAGDGVGGTWHWNRYPGARCDVESLDYSYQFSDALQEDWRWDERYASQPEILRYLEHVAERFNLLKDIRLSTRVEAAVFDEARGLWRVKTDDDRPITAKWLVMATGCLSRPSRPVLAGAFDGAIYHTGEWPRAGVDFAGQRVGVIGTGSSGVQVIPQIAGQAVHLTVFQRTAAYCAPAHNGPLDPAVHEQVKADYAAFRALSNAQMGGFQLRGGGCKASDLPRDEQVRVLETCWARGGLHFQAVFTDVLSDPASNQIVADFVRAKIRETVVDPEVAARLSPTQPIGCKRLCVENGYYDTFNRPNVELIDVAADPVEALTAQGLRTASGAAFEFDTLVFATGYDAMTGALAAIDIRGREGLSLGEAWREGPKTQLGVATAGFPNLFLVTGPGSPSVLTNLVASIEQHVAWIVRCIAEQEARGVAVFETTERAQDEWGALVSHIAGRTLFSGCNSWYMGANVPGKPRVFMPFAGGLPAFRQACDRVADAGYSGFITSPSADAHCVKT